MTMPHLMNCPHSESGWCLECVKKLQEKLEHNKEYEDAIAKYVYLSSTVLEAFYKFPELVNLMGNVTSFRQLVEMAILEGGKLADLEKSMETTHNCKHEQAEVKTTGKKEEVQQESDTPSENNREDVEPSCNNCKNNGTGECGDCCPSQNYRWEKE